MIVANLSAKSFDAGTTYYGFDKLKIGKEKQTFPLQTKKEETSVFLEPILKREVSRLDKKTKKQLLRLCKATLAVSVSLLALTNPKFAIAATVVQTVAQVAPTPAPMPQILPKDLVEAGMWIIGTCALISTILAIVLTQLAGNYRMFGKGQKASEWTIDILKGYTQTILAPVIILIIAFVCYLFFGDWKWFVKPF